MTTRKITADQAEPGRVYETTDGQFYQAPDGTGAGGWSTMQPIGFMGTGPESTAPAGELTLMVRDDGDAG